MYYYILPTDQDLQHHGILGMKWGVRRYQPYSVVPRGSGKGGKEIGIANRAAKRNVKTAYKNVSRNLSKAELYEARVSRYEYKIKKAKEKGDTEKVDKLKNKKSNYIYKNEYTYKKRLEVLNKSIDEVDKSIEQIGRDKVNKILEVENNKNNFIKTVGYTLLTGGTAIMITRDSSAMNYIKNESGRSKEFKEEKKKIESSSLSSEEKSKKIRLADAKMNERYSMDFQEAIQNSKIFQDNNKSAMLKEYDKYLKDPEDYWKNERHKLKQA